MSSSLPLWVQHVQALGPTFVAVVAAVIASIIQFRQWKTAHQKVRVDLYDRRFEQFELFLSLVRDMNRVETWDSKNGSTFASNTISSRFMFGQNIDNIRVDLMKSSIVADFVKSKLDTICPSEMLEVERERLMLKQTLMQLDFRIVEEFTPYLSLARIQD